jgi:hypothetical protein
LKFKIDAEAGKCETQVKGIQGPACEKIALQLKQLSGNPSVDAKTKQYFMKSQNIRRVNSK